MGLLDSVRKLFGQPAGAQRETTRHASAEGRAGSEVQVPEVTATELISELGDGTETPPVLLDCREDFERRQSFIPDSLHIPMNSIPYQVAQLDKGREIVVYCAHGNRSYGVAGWLIQQGFSARSLKGGIVDWQARSGAVETPYGRR